jgi:hypothetical protein
MVFELPHSNMRPLAAAAVLLSLSAVLSPSLATDPKVAAFEAAGDAAVSEPSAVDHGQGAWALQTSDAAMGNDVVVPALGGPVANAQEDIELQSVRSCLSFLPRHFLRQVLCMVAGGGRKSLDWKP